MAAGLLSGLMLPASPVQAVTVVHDTQAEFEAGLALDSVEWSTQTGDSADSLHLKPTSDYTVTADTKLLLEMDGSAGSTTFTDSTGGHTMTANGNARLSAGAAKFGPTSGYLDGTGDTLTTPSSTDFDFGSGAFTVDWWEYRTSLANASGVISRAVATPLMPYIFGYSWSGPGTEQVYLSSDNVSWDIASGKSLGSIVLNSWQHLAVTRSGDNFYAFRNGVLTDSWTSSAAIASSSGSLVVGSYNTPENYYQGYLDSVRITKGRALWTENFRPPAAVEHGEYRSSVIDAGELAAWSTLTWTEQGVQTGDGETLADATSLVAQWNFNETSGTTAASSAGSCGASCNGTLTNFASTGSQDAADNSGWTADNRRWGAGALMFDGTNDSANVTKQASMDITGSASLDAWVQPLSVPTAGSTYAYIVSDMKNTGGTYTSNYTLEMNGDVGGAFLCVTKTAADSWSYLTYSSTIPRPGQWYHVTCVFDTAAQESRIYVDGRLEMTGVAPAVLTTTSRPMYFGVQDDGVGLGNYFKGNLDSVRLFARVLSTAEVRQNFQSGNVEFQTRSGNTANPDDGTWEDWKPVTGQTQLLALDSDAANWSWDSLAADAPLGDGDESSVLAEGSGSLSLRLGAPQVDANTVGLWNFEETGGTGAYIADSVSTHHGTPTGTTVVDGVSGKARSFSGTGESITVPDDAAFNFGTGDFTVETWVNSTMPQTAGWYPTVVSKEAASPSHTGYALRLYASTSFAYPYFDYIVAGSQAYAVASVSVRDGKWHHLVGVKTSSSLKIYVDGVLSGSAGHSLGSVSNSGNVYMGPGSDGTASLDGVRLSNVARSADWVAEQYRLGRAHTLTRSISATDLSSQGKLPLYVAADRPGTRLEATVGESDFANSEPDANTMALWHLEEADGAGAYLKDSSSSANHVTPAGTTVTDGIIAKGRYFNGTTDSLTAANSASLNFGTGDFTIEVWLNTAQVGGTYPRIINKDDTSGSHTGWGLATYRGGLSLAPYLEVWSGGSQTILDSKTDIRDGKWHYLVGQRSGSLLKIYIDGVFEGSTAYTGGSVSNTAGVTIGRSNSSTYFYQGSMDEIRLSNTARSAADIRAAYEVGARTHGISIDFAASLDSGNLIADSNDLSFTADGTGFGLAEKASGLYRGDTVIVRENYNGTTYVAQGTVDSVSASTGAVTVAAWSGASTFPSGGFTAGAAVMKWQREWLDISEPLDSQLDAVARITLRAADGGSGANVWLDDLRSASSYLTDPATSSNITSANGRYLQYRAIMNTNSVGFSPGLTQVSTSYSTNIAPVANPDSGYAVAEGAVLSVSAGAGVLANDTDEFGGDPLTADKVTDPLQGAVSLAADGSFVYTPPANWSGIDSFTYRAYDGLLYSDATSVEIAVSTADYATTQGLVMVRQRAGESSDITLNFTLANTITGTFTMTFPTAGAPSTGFTVNSAFTSGSCAGGGTVDTFGYTSGTLTAEKHSCVGLVTLSGANITLPTTPSLYTATFVNDDPGTVVIPVLDDDTVSVTSNIDPTLTFDLDVSIADGESLAPYIVDLGALTSAAPSGSNGTTIPSIWIDLQTNAAFGAVVTVRSLNQGLASTSNPSDEIAASTEALVANNEGYGLCVASASGTQDGGHTFAAQAPYASTCTAGSFSVGTLNASATDLLVADGPISGGRSQVRVAASATNTTAAHPDYTDLLTFLATATF